MNQRFDDMVLGAGMGGLCLAGLLARDGRRVLLLEAAERPGGYARRLDVGPARFCAQVQYVFDCGETEPVDQLLGALGLRERVEWLRLDPEGFDMVSFGGERYRIPNGHAKHRERLVRKFPAAEWPLRAYFDMIVDTRDELLQIPTRPRITDLMAAPFRFPHALRYSSWTLEDMFDRVEMPELLRGILAGQCGDYFLAPDRSSFLVHTSLTSAYDRGAFYPRFHFEDLVAKLAAVVEVSPGSAARYGAEVVEILRDGDRAVGARTADGEEFLARRLISNIDPARTAAMAGGPREEGRGSWRVDYEYSASPFNLYLVLEGLDLGDHGFGNWNLWHYPHPDLPSIYRRQLEERDLSDPWFFASSPSLMSPEPGLALPGQQTLHVVTCASHAAFREARERGEAEYRALVDRSRDAVLDVLEAVYVPRLRDHLVEMRVHSPLDNARLFRAPQGNAYGAALTPANVTMHRHAYRSPLEGLYLLNATAGYPGVAGMAVTAMELHRELRVDGG